jgi:hypothetical protein
LTLTKTAGGVRELTTTGAGWTEDQALAGHFTGATRGRKRNRDSSASRQMASDACGGIMGRLISQPAAASPRPRQRFRTRLCRAMPRSSVSIDVSQVDVSQVDVSQVDVSQVDVSQVEFA